MKIILQKLFIVFGGIAMVGGVIVFVKDIREADSYSATASFLNILKRDDQVGPVGVIETKDASQDLQTIEIEPEDAEVDSPEAATPVEDNAVIPNTASDLSAPIPAPLASVFMSITAPIGPLGGGGGGSSPAPANPVSEAATQPASTSTTSSTTDTSTTTTSTVEIVVEATTTSDGREMLEKTFMPLSMCVPAESVATTSITVADHLTIARVLVDNEGADTNEFIEISNPTGADVLLTGWSLQYLSGGATSFASIAKKNFVASTTVLSGGRFVVGMGDFAGEADMRWSQSLNNAGATIFLIHGQTVIGGTSDTRIVDRVAYGAGAGLKSEGDAAPLPAIGQMLVRKSVVGGACVVSAEQSAPNYGCDTENNANDFAIETLSAPAVSSE